MTPAATASSPASSQVPVTASPTASPTNSVLPSGMPEGPTAQATPPAPEEQEQFAGEAIEGNSPFPFLPILLGCLGGVIVLLIGGYCFQHRREVAAAQLAAHDGDEELHASAGHIGRKATVDNPMHTLASP